MPKVELIAFSSAGQELKARSDIAKIRQTGSIEPKVDASLGSIISSDGEKTGFEAFLDRRYGEFVGNVCEAWRQRYGQNTT